MAFLVAAVVGLVFGAGDQYLGSLRAVDTVGYWAISVSLMSAPWLLLPFLAGRTQDRARRAALIGLVATTSALVGYFAMTLSPFEGVALGEAKRAAAGLLRSNVVVIVGGFVTAPVFGLLGQRWRVDRWWVSAAAVAGAFLLEPAARVLRGQPLGSTWVTEAEVVVGLGLAAAFLLTRAGRRPAERAA